MLGPQDILDFWFGPIQPDGTSGPEFGKRWFGGGPEFDEEIRIRFGPALQHALVWFEHSLQGVASPYDSWLTSPRGRLAAIVLLDQFPRNLFRRDQQAFCGDQFAQRLAWEGISLRMDLELGWDERVFFYLPLEHGESWEWQQRSLEKFSHLASSVPAELSGRYNNFLRYAQAHADIIQRFGRYPHRNEALGRPSSPAELEFLNGPGSSFW